VGFSKGGLPVPIPGLPFLSGHFTGSSDCHEERPLEWGCNKPQQGSCFGREIVSFVT